MRRGLWILAVLAVAIPVWSATGGPDGYGYYLIDSGTPGGPAYDFEDISATGTTVTLTDDSLSAGTPMGFLFNFYGANVNVMSICSNGFLTPLVGQSGSPWLSAPIPTGDSPNALIAGWWNDFNPQAGGAIYTETRGTAPNRRFLVQFQDVPHYNGTTSDSQTVEYKIFESDNSIEVHYARVPYMDVVFSDDRHCAGIENAEGNFGLSYHYDASPLDTPVAVRYYMRADALRPWLASPDLSGRAGGPFDVSMTTLSLGNTMATSASWAAHSEAAWLDIVPAFGTVGGNTTTTAEVRVGAAAASLLPGVYSTAVVCSNTATGAEWVLGVELEVLDPLEVSPEGPYAWAGGSGGPIVPEVTTVTLSNFGAGAVNWAISGAPSWLQASTGSGSLNGNASSTIALSVNPSSALLAPGHYAGTVSFDNLTHGTSQEFDVTLDIVNLARVPVFEDFESPALADYWTIGGSGESRTTVTTAYDPCAGSRHLTMDTPLSGVYARNELTIGVDVGNRTGLTLSFLARDYGDESHPPASDTFTGGADFDGVAISGDGETWHVVQHLTDAAGLGDTCTTFTVDLDAAMASSGLAGAELLFVRFNQYDNYPIDQDGIAIDNVSITGAFTGGLTVTPSETFLASGAEGGPILPAAKTYVLTNTGGTASVWSAESDASWLDVSPTTGSVAAMSTATLRLATAASVNLLTPGLHVAQVRLGEQSGAVQYVNAQARVLDRLNVSPEDTWHALGIVGGPFYPTTRTYTVSNAGALPTAWRADVSVAWLRVSPSSGTLNGGVAENVTVRIEDSASSLSFGTYDVPVVFTNLDSGAQVLREVSLRVSQGHLVDLSLPAGSLPYATVWGDDAGDMLGYGRQSMAFGDVNGDGYDDLIVGAPYGSPGGRNEAGEVTVVYGNAAAAGASIDLDTDGAISVAGETRILGDDADDRFGWSVASGDVNGDGIDDIVIGAPFANVLFTDPAGEVVIVYGRSDLPGRVVDLNTDGAVSVEGETRILGDEEQDQTGYAVAVGDVDGDGRADVIMGAPRYDTWWTYGGAGQVIVVNGASGIEGRVVDLDTDGAVSAWGEVRILGDDANDQFGVSVASGDVNGDGYADVVVGAPRMRQASGGGPGEAYVVYGGTHMASATLSLDTDGAISAWGETRVLGDDADDAFGWSVASGDVNGDGFDDVVIGAPVATVGGLVQCGEVAVVYGGVGLSTRSISLDTDGAISVENETRIRGGEDMAEAGISVAVVDGNGDGVDDVIVGMPGSSPSGGGDGAGMVAVIAGGGDLPGDIVSMTGAWGWARIEGGGELDSLGMATGGGGDMNRDGAVDFAAGAPLGSGTAGYGVVAMGESATTEALRTRHSRAGDAPVTDFGPVLRCAVDFESGDASTDIVTIERVAPSGLSATGGVLPVNWRVLSTRGGGWTASLSFRYTDAELDGRTESGLRVLMSPTGASGTWFVAGTGQTVVASMNRIDVSGVSGQGYFAIVDGDVLTPTPTPTPTTSPTPTATPSPTPTPTPTGVPANTWFEEAQTVSLTSDGHFYAAAYNLTQNTFLDSVDTSFSATLDISVTDGDWLGLYVYDYSDGVWTRGLYVLKDAL